MRDFMEDDKKLGKLVMLAYESIKSKLGLIKSLESHPSVTVHCSLDSDYGRGFIDCLIQLRPEYKVTRVKLYSSLGSLDFYVHDVVSFRKFLEDEIEKIRRPEKPHPAKVAARMLGVRFNRVRTSVNEACLAMERTIETNQGWAKLKKDNPSLVSQYEDQINQAKLTIERFTLPDLKIVTVRSLGRWLREVIKAMPSHSNMKPFIELENFLARPDVDESMLRMAVDLVLVGEVMES
jgi:hypothetical protein